MALHELRDPQLWGCNTCGSVVWQKDIHQAQCTGKKLRSMEDVRAEYLKANGKKEIQGG